MSLVDKPDTCAACPLYRKAKGFALDYGDPRRCRFVVQLEQPGKSEIMYAFAAGQFGVLDQHELARRKTDYPDVGERYLKNGAALIGKSWSLISQWVFARLGIRRDDLFITNTLRCFSPEYPTGDDRKIAEAYCRQYDRLHLYCGGTPDALASEQLVIIGIHPAAVLRDVTLLPLLIRSAEKAADGARAGAKTILLLGGKAVRSYLGYFDAVSKYQGHYTWTSQSLTQFQMPPATTETSDKPKRGHRQHPPSGLFLD